MNGYSLVAMRRYSMALTLVFLGCQGSPGTTSAAESRNGSETLPTAAVDSTFIDIHASDTRTSDGSSTGASVGTVVHDAGRRREPVSAERLIDEADAAMYADKASTMDIGSP